MSRYDEIWGTFAVDDHLRPRAFVAETVLFDRLVIPQPPPKDDEEYLEWTQAGWHPERLKDTLAPLGDLAIAVPWDKPLRAQWQTQYSSLTPADRAALRMKLAQDAAFDSKGIQRTPPNQLAKYVTRELLANKLNEQADNDLYQKIRNIVSIDPAAEIEAVVAYGSYAKFREEVPLDETQAPNRPIADTALLVSWEFLVPEDSELTDAQLLERAAALSQKSEFRDSRRQFHEWRRKLIGKQVSIEAARSEMNRCLAIYNDIVDKTRLRSRALTALQVVALAAPLADFVLPGLGVAGGVAFAGGAFLADKLVPVPQVGERERKAALVHDSREAFGWKDSKAAL